MKSIMIAHSNPETVKALETALIQKGIKPTQISEGAGVLDFLNKQPVSVLLTEKDLPKVSGEDLLRQIREEHPDIRVVLISPDLSSRAAAKAVRAGAYDYLSEPIDPEELAACLDRLVCDDQTGSGVETYAKTSGRYDHIIGQSTAIRDVFRLVDKVAGTDSTVMIYGESGTGKELIARAIHENSRRWDKPLIPVNCGAIPEELLESELFGHEKGAFTSAIRTRIGRFEMSDGGTIFLDEIADMSPKLQVKILRVLQEHQFERIGGAKTLEVDIRVITATNKNLRQAMEEGRFREDLFYRLNVIPITVPPLRNRREDIPALIEHFLTRFRQLKGAEVETVTSEAMDKLLNYSWPGNIRELENIIERMVILADTDTLTLDDLPPRISEVPQQAQTAPIDITQDGIDFNKVVSEFENQLLVQALEKSGWVKNKAAQLLNLNRTTLVEKLKKKDITPPKF